MSDHLGTESLAARRHATRHSQRCPCQTHECSYSRSSSRSRRASCRRHAATVRAILYLDDADSALREDLLAKNALMVHELTAASLSRGE